MYIPIHAAHFYEASPVHCRAVLIMACEVPLSPSQVRRDGHWQPIKHKTAPSLRSPLLTSQPPRRPSLRAVLRRKPLSIINEDKTPSVKSDSTVSLRLNTNLPYQPSAWPRSSEHLIHFHPSQQLQNFQSVSFHCTDEAYDTMPRMYRTHSQWAAPSPRPYETNDIPIPTSPTVYRSAAWFNQQEQSDAGVRATTAGDDVPREAIADLFHRAEEYERENPKVVRESGKVWVRVNSIGYSLAERLKRMGSLRKKRTFEARVGRKVPIQSQLRVYEKPSGMQRVKIGVHDCWRKFRNWSTGRDTELWANKSGAHHPYNVLNASMMSLSLHERSTTRHQSGPRRLSRPARTQDNVHHMRSVREGRRDSKMSTREQMKRRKSSLFLDVYSSDISLGSSFSRR